MVESIAAARSSTQIRPSGRVGTVRRVTPRLARFIQGKRFEGYSSAAVTTESPGFQGYPSAIRPMPVSGVGDEGDLVDVGVDQAGAGDPGPLDLLAPARPVDDAVPLLVVDPVAERLARPPGQRGHGGVVEVGPVLGDRELPESQRVPVHRDRSSIGESNREPPTATPA